MLDQRGGGGLAGRDPAPVHPPPTRSHRAQRSAQRLSRSVAAPALVRYLYGGPDSARPRNGPGFLRVARRRGAVFTLSRPESLGRPKGWYGDVGKWRPARIVHDPGLYEFEAES